LPEVANVMRKRSAILLAAALLIVALPRADAQQFNSADGSTRTTTDSAFRLFWDNTADVMKFQCAVSNTAGSAITWVDGPSLNTSCVMSGVGAAGADTQVIFNDGGVYAGDSGLVFDKTGNVLSVSGALALGLVSGNAPASIALGDLAGVSLASPANGECLVYNGTNWVDTYCGGTTSPGTVNLTADNQLVTVGNNSYIRVSSNDATPTNRTFCLSAGTAAGQQLIIEQTGNGFQAEMEDLANPACTGDAPQSLTATMTFNSLDDTLSLIWNGTSWLETARANN
jgi:hypothetical protein